MLVFLLFDFRQLIKGRGVTQPDRKTDRSISLMGPPLLCLHQLFPAFCVAGLISEFFNMRCQIRFYTIHHFAPHGGEGDAISSSHLSLVCLQGCFRAAIERWPEGRDREQRSVLHFITTRWRDSECCCVVTVCCTNVILL